VSHIRADLCPYLQVLTRRWTVIVPAIVLLPLAALLLAMRQERVYSATAQVLLTYSSPGASLNGLATPYPGTSPDRNVATQTALAQDPAVAERALRLSHVSGPASSLLAMSTVSSPNDSDLLDFSVQNASVARAETLATNYARAYTIYRSQLDAQAITSALAGINAQIARLTHTGQTASTAFRTLTHDQQALTAAVASGTSDAVLAQPAQSGIQVSPHPARSAALGLGVGVALAIALAFLMETFDQRVAVDEVERRLKIPRLASIPASRRWRRDVRALVTSDDEPGHRDRRAASLAVLDDPNGQEAKSFRVLKSSLEFARLEHDFKSLLFTSARPYAGQAETVANLAITLAQGGQRVLLCDLNACRPSIGDLFGLEGQPGFVELIRGWGALENAVVPIPDRSLGSSAPVLAGGDPGISNGSAGVRPGHPLTGSLDVLPFGGPAPHSGFLGTRAASDLLEQLGHAPYDCVLVDAPPLLVSGEAHTLSTLSDAVIVALPDPVRMQVIDDLAATLTRLPVMALGFVIVGPSRALATTRPPGPVTAPTPEPDLVSVTPIRNRRWYRTTPPSRRVEAFRSVPRNRDRLRDN
jgi:Mrp family chromosome partitioning ATPase/capsular polysaccharide biosynthesis protein